MIVLVGFMGSGKTTVGRLLSEQMGLPFVDTDASIEAIEGEAVADIFRSKGEPYFRELERSVVMQILEGPASVVALGGGAIGDPAIAAALEWYTVVYLETSFQEVWRRLKDDRSRPLMTSGDPRALYEQRSPRYGQLSSLSVTTDGRDPVAIATEIAALLRSPAREMADQRKVTLSLGERSYTVEIGTGLIDRVGELLPELPGCDKAFVITHPSLRDHAGRVVASLRASGLETRGFDVPEGEGSKDFALVGQLLTNLAEEEAHRSDLIVGVGGGVVCDLAGFVASVYARGLPCAHVPTSLLAQVDAAIGGKTGVNLPTAKNLAGTFHQPRLVVCDVETLATLPEAELRSGLAEVVKYGLIAEPQLLDVLVKRADEILARVPTVLEEIVSRSAWIKANVVSSDEKEQAVGGQPGVRAHLNYGHTFAHAIEAHGGFGRIRHGEAVAIGMMAAAHLGRILGWLDLDAVALHRSTLRAVGLPVGARLTLEELQPAWSRDKKYERGVRFVLLSAIGSPVAGVEVEEAALRAALEALASEEIAT